MPAQGGIVMSTSGSSERSSGRTILAVILGIIALIFIVVAIIYIAEPAKSLPSFVPGHIAGSAGQPPPWAIPWHVPNLERCWLTTTLAAVDDLGGAQCAGTVVFPAVQPAE